MKYPRMVGQNIELVMREKNISNEELARVLGFSELDIHRIQEGVLMLSGNELEEVAETLGVTIQNLTEKREESDYRELLHCMGDYHDVENKDKILDYIDMYIEIEEARTLAQ